MDLFELKQLISQDTQLHILPQGFPELLKTLASDNVSHPQIAEAITKFPSVAARLLFLSNSSWAAPSIPIVTLEMACARLGLSMVRSVSVALSVSSTFNISLCKSFDGERFWCSALSVADGAMWLAASMPDLSEQDVKTIHTAGLLHNIGLLWLANKFSEETSKALGAKVENDIMPTIEILREIVGTDYCEVGEILGNAWALPDIFVSVMGQHRNAKYQGSNLQYVVPVSYAAQMVSSIVKGVKQCPELTGEKLELNSPGLNEIYARLIEKVDENRAIAKLLSASI